MIDITSIAQALIALLGVIITAILIPYIRSRTTAEQRAKLQTWINVAVYAAEQMFQFPGTGEDKKSYVLKFLQAQGITYDATAIDAMIEAAVKTLNIAQGAASTVTASAATSETVVMKPPGADNDFYGDKYIIQNY